MRGNAKVLPEGTRFGRLTVARRIVGARGNGGALVYYLDCDCGGSTQATGTDLRADRFHSCGCENRGRYKAVIYEHNEQRHPLRVWAERVGVPKSTLYRRIKSGWPLGQALGFEKRPELRDIVKPYDGTRTSVHQRGGMKVEDAVLAIGISRQAFYTRLRHGWPVDLALSTPHGATLRQARRVQ